jgi:hypothetical protein
LVQINKNLFWPSTLLVYEAAPQEPHAYRKQCALLACIGSRLLLNRGPALAVPRLCIGPLVLLRSVENQQSPNGEILGSVLFLAISAILVHRPPGRGALFGVIGLVVRLVTSNARWWL